MAKLSYKVSYYALYVMFAIILVVLGMFFLHSVLCSYYCYRGWCFVPIWSCTERQSGSSVEIFDWFGYIGCSCCYFLDYG